MRGFHGRTMGALSATYTKEYREPFVPVVEGFQFAPFNNFAKLAEKVNDNTAAVMLEIVQGEGGVNVGKAEFFAQVSELCREKGILLILDEVQTGFCRTGKMFACEHFGLEPDILCLAKAMAGGIPMGAVVCSDKIEVPVGRHGSTFGGNPLACAASLAAIDAMIEERLAEAAAEKGAYLMERLKAAELPRVRDIRQLGLMIRHRAQGKVPALPRAAHGKGRAGLARGSDGGPAAAAPGHYSRRAGHRGGDTHRGAFRGDLALGFRRHGSRRTPSGIPQNVVPDLIRDPEAVR